MLDDVQRDVESIRLPVLDSDGQPVEPIVRFLGDFVARGNKVTSIRSYAYALMRWWRFLLVIEVHWDRVTSAEVRDFVLWLRYATKPGQRTASAVTAGTVNPVTRKKHLDTRYQVRTLRHSNAVLRTFYEYWIELGHPPLINPVPLDRRRGGRPGAHHNPMEPWQRDGKLRYNPKVPNVAPEPCPMSVGTTCSARCAPTGTGRSSRWPSAPPRGPPSCWVLALPTWTGETSSSAYAARAPARSSGCRPARRRSSGYGSTWPTSVTRRGARRSG